MDEDGYPEESELKQVAEWSHADIPGLLKFLLERWWCPDFCWDIKDGKLFLSTGGWSGNESFIAALQKNVSFWYSCWESSRRGGHYEFDLSRVKL